MFSVPSEDRPTPAIVFSVPPVDRAIVFSVCAVGKSRNSPDRVFRAVAEDCLICSSHHGKYKFKNKCVVQCQIDASGFRANSHIAQIFVRSHRFSCDRTEIMCEFRNNFVRFFRLSKNCVRIFLKLCEDIFFCANFLKKRAKVLTPKSAHYAINKECITLRDVSSHCL